MNKSLVVERSGEKRPLSAYKRPNNRESSRKSLLSKLHRPGNRVYIGEKREGERERKREKRIHRLKLHGRSRKAKQIVPTVYASTCSKV